MTEIDICKSTRILKEIFEITKPDEGHGIEHAFKVQEHSLKALNCSKEDITDRIRLLVQLSSLLHDVEDHKFVKVEDKGKWVKYFFDEYFDGHYRSQDLELVMEIIDSVSCSKYGDTRTRDEKWFYITRYSDRLEATGEIGIKRAKIYSERIQRPLFCPETVVVNNRKELHDKINRDRYIEYIGNGGKTSYSETMIDHLYDKVMHIEVPEWMDNEYLIKESEVRKSYVEGWIIGFWQINKSVVRNGFNY